MSSFSPAKTFGLSFNNSVFLLFVAIIAATSLGCAPRLSSRGSTEITPAEIRSILVDPISRDQTITVEASSSVPFNIHIHLSEDSAEVDKAISAGKDSEKILAGQTSVKSAKLEAHIPANSEAAIRFECAGAESGSVSYTILN